jgi:hypothetical protein
LTEGKPWNLYGVRTAANGLLAISRSLRQGDPHAASRLLPLVYDAPCKLAAQMC